jgi:type II secretory pathway component GspD/PulD (secretin)
MLQLFRSLGPVFEGGAQGVPVFYNAFVTEGSKGKPGMNKGVSNGVPEGGMARMANIMPRVGGPGVSSATPTPGSSCYFAIDQRTRSLIVRGTEKDLQVVGEFVAMLDLPDDKPIPKLKNVHAFKLRFTKPDDVIGVLRALNIDVLVAQIPKSTIVLLNGPDSAIKEATEIIEALDAEVKESTPASVPAPGAVKHLP